jgi:pyrroline-5-carboxylate reductase
MEKKIGFIGCGNMGKAILGGLIASGQVLPGQIWVYTPSPDKVAALRDQYGLTPPKARRKWPRSPISSLAPSSRTS